MRTLVRLLPVLLLVPGCLPDFLNPSPDPETQLVVNSPFGTSRTVGVAANKFSYEPAKSEAIAKRVANLGQCLLQTNPQIGMKPHFATYGTATPEVFHTGTHMVHITEGLVQKCRSDGQLAALLALELAKMAVEREAMTPPSARFSDEKPPMYVPIGSASQPGQFDPVRQAELAYYEQRHPPHPSRKPLALPDPAKLARGYLERAGYDPGELAGVTSLLEEAEHNFVLEKQVRQFSGNAPSPWQAAGAVPASVSGAK
jgi:hypothetical protein